MKVGLLALVSWRKFAGGAGAAGLKDRCRRTNSHNDQETSQETTKVNDSTAGAFHKIIGVGCTAAYPIGQRRDNVGRDDQQRKVVMP